LTAITRRAGAFYISIDIDLLDASCAAGTGTPASGGHVAAGVIIALPGGIP
jgi:arginase family enzyme